MPLSLVQPFDSLKGLIKKEVSPSELGAVMEIKD